MVGHLTRSRGKYMGTPDIFPMPRLSRMTDVVDECPGLLVRWTWRSLKASYLVYAHFHVSFIHSFVFCSEHCCILHTVKFWKFLRKMWWSLFSLASAPNGKHPGCQTHTFNICHHLLWPQPSCKFPCLPCCHAHLCCQNSMGYWQQRFQVMGHWSVCMIFFLFPTKALGPSWALRTW